MSTIARTTVSIVPSATPARSSSIVSGPGGMGRPFTRSADRTSRNAQAHQPSTEQPPQKRGRRIDVLLHRRPSHLRLAGKDRGDHSRVLPIGVLDVGGYDRNAA